MDCKQTTSSTSKPSANNFLHVQTFFLLWSSLIKLNNSPPSKERSEITEVKHTWEIEIDTSDLVVWISVPVPELNYSVLTLSKFKIVWNLLIGKILVKMYVVLLNVDIINTCIWPSAMTCLILWNLMSTCFVLSWWTLFFDKSIVLWESQNTPTPFCSYPNPLVYLCGTKLPWQHHSK